LSLISELITTWERRWSRIWSL